MNKDSYCSVRRTTCVVLLQRASCVVQRGSGWPRPCQPRPLMHPKRNFTAEPHFTYAIELRFGTDPLSSARDEQIGRPWTPCDSSCSAMRYILLPSRQGIVLNTSPRGRGRTASHYHYTNLCCGKKRLLSNSVQTVFEIN